MKDNFGRTINYLRLSITDRCNMRCQYCMPAEGVVQKTCGEILRYEEMLRIVETAALLGVRKVRVTGGEPLVRKGVIGFLQQLSAISGIKEIALTTNGLLLAEQAAALRQAGVSRLNVSLDSLDRRTFAEITRGGELEKVRAGLDAAAKAGLQIKLNMVVMRGVNDHEIIPFAALSREHPWSVRFIEYMPTIREPRWRQQIVTGAEILTRIREHFELQTLSSERFCGPAKPYRIAGAIGTLGIITPMSEHFCGACNRIRVTSTGLAKSCLLSGAAVDLTACLRQPDNVALQKTLRKVIASKPGEHQLTDELDDSVPFSMAQIGG